MSELPVVPAEAPVEVPATPAPRTVSERRKSTLRLGLEVVLIAVGVFLGLMGEQWRERAEHRELAESALRRIRAEFVKNREAVASVKDKHVDGLKAMRTYLAADAATQRTLPYPFRSTSPAFFEYSAWDLALATQSLAYIDPDLAQSIAHVYAAQRQLDGATRDITHVMYTKIGDDPISFLRSMTVYFGDCALIEPRLIAIYDRMIPRLDEAIGGPSEREAGK